jgi:hypothetical protein
LYSYSYSYSGRRQFWQDGFEHEHEHEHEHEQEQEHEHEHEHDFALGKLGGEVSRAEFNSNRVIFANRPSFVRGRPQTLW